MISWGNLDADRFERVVQMLVRDVFGATSIDGAGGDLAQDLRRNTPEGLEVYEVKSFEKRLGSSQKRQARNSYLRASQLHSPHKWILITRSNPTPGEFSWLQSLSSEAPGVILEWLGRDWLDSVIAGREDLISYVEGPDYKLLRRAQLFEQERSVLTSGTELAARERQLHQLGDSISPYWRWESGNTAEGLTHTLVPKRPESATADPIVLTPTFRFPDEDAEALEVSKRLTQALRVGGDVTVPGRLIETFSVKAASAATQRLLGPERQDVTALKIMSIPDEQGLPMAATIVLQPEQGVDGASLSVLFERRHRGTHGFILEGAYTSKALQVSMTLDEGSGQPTGNLEVSLGPIAGRFPHEVIPALRLLASASRTTSVDLYVGRARIARFVGAAASEDDFTGALQLTGALNIVSGHCGLPLRIPSQMTLASERALHEYARAIAGQRVRMRFDSVTVGIVPGHARELAEVVGEGLGAIYFTPSELDLDLGEESVHLPGLAFYGPRMRLCNYEALMADAEGVGAEFYGDGDGIYLVRAVDEPEASWRAIPSEGITAAELSLPGEE